MNFTKNGKSGPNLQQANFEKFELGISGSWLRVLRTSQRSLFGVNTQRENGSSFVNL